eukprot:TRINITY_DN1443_c0_g1_i1.p1 TRINITY_DN1443_c0_g1~~TRINITY_DN1443_c0_g1_i1.p1  ORF type:complete len:430 (-),score=179.29 TRINITY_DN1443_c0_g1_i1:96-1310(-)
MNFQLGRSILHSSLRRLTRFSRFSTMSKHAEETAHIAHVTALPESIPAMAAMQPGKTVEKWAYTPKVATPEDVDFIVSHCGLCHSDVHTITDDWDVLKPGQPDTMLPMVPGHEVVGRVTAVGSAAASRFAVGDIVGLGAQSYKCGDCLHCNAADDNACLTKRITYSHKVIDDANPAPGQQHYGGFASALRTHHSMLFKVPAGLDPSLVGPLMCAGITTYAPLEDHQVAGKKVGILGVGGLGHLAIQFASKGFGAETVAISRGTGKKDLCMELGATAFLDSTNEEDVKKHLGTFDVLLVTAAGGSFDLEKHLKWCRPKRGRIHIVGAIDEPMKIAAFPLILAGGVSISGSLLGTSEQMLRMFDMCVDKGIRPMIKVFPHSEANTAIAEMLDNKLKFRAVLKNDLL